MIVMQNRPLTQNNTCSTPRFVSLWKCLMRLPVSKTHDCWFVFQILTALPVSFYFSQFPYPEFLCLISCYIVSSYLIQKLPRETGTPGEWRHCCLPGQLMFCVQERDCTHYYK